MDPLSELQKLRDDIAANEKLRTKRELERDTAAKAMKDAAEKLQSEFGVSTLSEAKALETDLQDQLDKQVAAMAAKLKEA